MVLPWLGSAFLMALTFLTALKGIMPEKDSAFTETCYVFILLLTLDFRMSVRYMSVKGIGLSGICASFLPALLSLIKMEFVKAVPETVLLLGHVALLHGQYKKKASYIRGFLIVFVSKKDFCVLISILDDGHRLQVSRRDADEFR